MLLAVDTGGTKTLVTSFSGSKPGKQFLFETPKDPADYIKKLAAVIVAYRRYASIKTIVIGVPGIVKDGVAIWCNNLGWKNFAIVDQLSRLFPDTPIYLENDANLAGLAEARALSPRPNLALYVTVSTGIGTGVISHGQIDPALRYSEGGRSLVEFDGVVREWESFASGQAIHKAFGQYARDIKNKKTWHQIADRISRGLLAAIPLLQPDVIIIGGSIGAHFSHYDSQLKAILKEKLPPHIPLPAIHQAKHPEQAVLYGCYYYAHDLDTAA